MSKRKQIYEIINEHIEVEHERDYVSEYIRNLHEKISELESSVSRKKKRRSGRRRKSKLGTSHKKRGSEG
ncbi:hypothetical protein [Oceanobacillus limi]|uniref:hypothetical protein n=1 Tax=Oceanobacillus limi TaxID=930131 RepID=UPI000B81589E|nr:hypothetical protein [Oceanobacillus limi]